MENGTVVEGTLHTYTIEAEIGKGGFGITHRATDESGQVVALKRLRLDRMDSWKALELFEREAAILRQLEHPCIPRYIEFFAMTDEGPIEHIENAEYAPQALILVQEFVAGADLGERLASAERFSTARMGEILRDLLDTLHYLHALSPPVIHRDVNPRNIIVSDDGDTYLVDFGAIQQRLREQTVGGSTSVGTLGYMPVEQSLGKARPASDLYALAVTTVVLMTGMAPEELPLDDDTNKIDLERLGLGGVDDGRERLVSFLELALEPAVGKRLQSARAGLDILDGKDAVALPEPSHLVRPTEAPNWKRTLFVLCLGGSLGGAGIIYPLNFNNFSETEMVMMAPFWVLPAAFGAAGLIALRSKRPVTNAIIGTLVGAGCLVGFFATVWPML